MKRLAAGFLVFGLYALQSATVTAQPFPVSDVRAMGMGGAFVAVGEGIGAVQYNPALMGNTSTTGLVLPELVMRMEDHIKLVDRIDRINDLGYSDPGVIPILEDLDRDSGLNVQASGAAGVGFGVFGLSAGVTYSRMVFGAAYPENISTDPVNLPDDTYNNLHYSGIEARQIIISGAGNFGNICAGANVRIMDATTYDGSEWLFADPGTDISDIMEGSESDESAVALDAGAVLKLTPLLNVGIMARDVNAPELGEWRFDPRYRIGVALRLPALTVAGDYDVTEDDMFGTEYRDWALGAEVDMWAVAFRVGVSRNFGLSGTPTLVHLGLGLGFLDIGAAYADEGEHYMAGVNLALGF